MDAGTIATLIAGAVEAVVELIRAGASKDHVLQQIQHLKDRAAALRADVDQVAQGG